MSLVFLIINSQDFTFEEVNLEPSHMLIHIQQKFHPSSTINIMFETDNGVISILQYYHSIINDMIS